MLTMHSGTHNQFFISFSLLLISSSLPLSFTHTNTEICTNTLKSWCTHRPFPVWCCFQPKTKPCVGAILCWPKLYAPLVIGPSTKDWKEAYWKDMVGFFLPLSVIWLHFVLLTARLFHLFFAFLFFSFCLFYLVINIIRLLGSNVLIYNARSTGAAPVIFILYSVSF